MKLIIAGGRDYRLTRKDITFLDNIYGDVYGDPELSIKEVVSGVCSGADLCGEIWAYCRNISVKHFPAMDYGKWPSCGPKRNEAMAQYADAIVLFPGGKGTENMYQNAVKYKLKIYDRRF